LQVDAEPLLSSLGEAFLTPELQKRTEELMRVYQWMRVSGALLLLQFPFAVSAATCAPPALAPVPPAGFTLATCEHKSWDTYDFSLPSGSKTIAGEQNYFHYELTGGKKDNDSAATLAYYIPVFQKSGATLMTAPGREDAIFDHKASDGETWYLLEQHNNRFTIISVKIATFPQSVTLRPMPGALDPLAPGCQDPPWLVKQFAYYKVSGCEKKLWDSVSMDIPSGHQQLEGPRVTVTYELIPGNEAPVGAAIGQNYLAAFQAIGAKMMTSLDKIRDYIVMTQAAPGGTAWYEWSRGSGNSGAVMSYSLMTIIPAPMPQEVVAQAVPAAGLQDPGKTCANPPWLAKQFSYFKISGCTFKDFDSITIDLPDGKKTIAGRTDTTVYDLTQVDHDPTALYVVRNYQNALKSIGATQLTKVDRDPLIATLKTDHGEFWYIYTHGSGNDQSTKSYGLTTFQVGGPTPKTCTLEVYGVNFDFDKSVIRPDSTPVLNEVLALFTVDPSFAAEVGGHTDNVGNGPYNLKLSDARASAVKDWLIQHGLPAARVTARGYGDTKPLVPNNSDDNRAKNRRVELKRMNCKN
jgi:outer membrane protein OmpA-like peptidoglycan-associated protein